MVGCPSCYGLGRRDIVCALGDPICVDTHTPYEKMGMLGLVGP